MITDLELAQRCAATYTAAPTLPVPARGTDCAVTTEDEGAVTVAFHGSVTAEDWVRDFICAPITDRRDPQLGPCHAGFLDGGESISGEVATPIAGRAYDVTGHSLGGARWR